MRLRMHDRFELFPLLLPRAASHGSSLISSLLCNICPISRNKVGKIRFFCIFIGFHLQISLLSRIMKQDYIGVVGRAA